MVFSSVVFLFLFLPVFLIGYFLFPKSLRVPMLLVFSLLFYFWGEGYGLWVILLRTVIDYLCALGIAGGFSAAPEKLDPMGARSRRQRAALIFSVVTNLLLLGYFKYFNFGVGNVTTIFEAFGWDAAGLQTMATVALPLGISFYTFQSMSYTIDVYRGEVTATRNYIQFAAYVTMFPQLVAGPIVRYCDVERDIRAPRVTLAGFALGVRRFSYGLAKKVILANSLATVADAAFALPPGHLHFSMAWLGALCYTLQIYYDFSGYSDMAIGMGLMLGFRFPENFLHPYGARSIKDFWRRWHISLSTWFRDYLYIPLGGNRYSALRTHFNLLMVFFVCGLWHGANWTFVVWGLYHGGFLILERSPAGRLLERLPWMLQSAYALLAVIFGWVLFRAESIGAAVLYMQTMLGMHHGDARQLPMGELVNLQVILALGIGVLFSFPVVPALSDWWTRKRVALLTDNRAAVVVVEAGVLLTVLALLVLSAASLASGVYNPFLYFRF